jgi:outer membrane protein assembly factor BamD (BamD/ComL family)
MRASLLLTIITATAVMVCTGCAGMRSDSPEQQTQQQANPPARNKLMAAEKLAQEAKYAEAITAYRAIGQEYPNTEWAPEAKYGIALVYLSTGNPHRDYAAAITEFDEFLSLYPSDKRASEAKNWRQILKVLLETKKDNDRLNKNIDKLKQLDVRQEEKRLGR